MGWLWVRWDRITHARDYRPEGDQSLWASGLLKQRSVLTVTYDLLQGSIMGCVCGLNRCTINCIVRVRNQSRRSNVGGYDDFEG